MDGYTAFAPYYDELSFDEFSKHCVLYVDHLIAAAKFNGHAILDLACGTGTAAILFAKQGYQVTGIDISPTMIKLARRKAREAKLPINFFCQDMRELKVSQQFDLVTCFFDAMNHLYTYPDFAKVFRNVSRLLSPAGLFIFDMNTEYGLKTNWGNKRHEQRNRNVRSIFVSKYIPQNKIVVINATVSAVQGNKIKKIPCQFANRAYTPEQVYRAITRARLTLVAEYDCFTFKPTTQTTSRIMYIAKKY